MEHIRQKMAAGCRASVEVVLDFDEYVMSEIFDGTPSNCVVELTSIYTTFSYLTMSYTVRTIVNPNKVLRVIVIALATFDDGAVHKNRFYVCFTLADNRKEGETKVSSIESEVRNIRNVYQESILPLLYTGGDLR